MAVCVRKSLDGKSTFEEREPRYLLNSHYDSLQELEARQANESQFAGPTYLTIAQELRMALYDKVDLKALENAEGGFDILAFKQQIKAQQTKTKVRMRVVYVVIPCYSCQNN